ncbi:MULTISPECIES: matrixin family metalloprotease [Nitrosopumilus]|uniref:matrixin family metalloprotease n=1 Tax=Nitrosopumilus TaxID=338191 RepID=UPI001E5A2F4C|nr:MULTISPECIES: matrixin family metalloprotease [Nitrosopumilus]
MAIVIAVAMITISNYAYGMEYDEQSIITPWDIQEDTISVLIMRDAAVQPYKIDIVEEVIKSNNGGQTKTQFTSWNNAIKNTNTKFSSQIPTLQIGHINNQNYITIYLKDEINSKYDGFTELTYKDGKIQNAFVSIYDSDEITPTQLKMLIRHELGHALGLGHIIEKPSIMNSIIYQQAKLITMFEMQLFLTVY